MNFEDALREANLAGYQLNNLWQTQGGLFTASLRDRQNGYEFASRPTAQEAVLAALSEALAGRGDRLLEGASASGVETKTKSTRKSEEELGL